MHFVMRRFAGLALSPEQLGPGNLGRTITGVPCVKRFGRAGSVRGAKTAVAVAPIVQGRNASRAESGSLLISTLHCVDRSRREQAEDRTQR